MPYSPHQTLYQRHLDRAKDLPNAIQHNEPVVAGIGRPIAIVKMGTEGAEFGLLRDIFAHPEAFDIDAPYCETQERSVSAEFAEIDRMRRASEAMARPHVNLYWP